MPTQQENDDTYMGVAILHSKLSKAMRLKVGACLVLENGALVAGVNGLPTELGNECEYFAEDGNLVTKPETIHAEQNAIIKVARNGLSTQNSSLYVTHSLCRACASAMIAAGVKEVVYKEDYRDTSGLDLLRQANIGVRKYE